jgi:hypothetical protein
MFCRLKDFQNDESTDLKILWVRFCINSTTGCCLYGLLLLLMLHRVDHMVLCHS